MKFRNTITVGERLKFVDDMVSLCTENGRVQYALQDFAFRTCVLIYFAQDVDVKEMSQDEIHAIVYGKEFRDAMADEDVKDILSSLEDACLETLRDVKSQYMEVFRSVANPNPMEQVAQGILDILEKVKPLLNQEEILNMLRQLHAEEAEKKKKAVKLPIVQKGK